jgi:hypothetical protein
MALRPRVLYVTGWCRSGTTLVGNLLNELDGVVHVGELHYLWRNGVLGSGTNTTCGCDTPVMDCPLWHKVLDLVGGPDPRAAARRWVLAQDRLVRTRHTVGRLSHRQPPAARELAARMTELYGAIAEVSGARTIVDSSKFPAEAALLAGAGSRDLDVRVLHMVRDPRATANSWLRPKDYIPAMSPARSTGYWTGFNAASELIRLRHPAISARLRHEDFVRDPRGGIEDILRLLDLAAAPPIGADGTAVLGVNHTVTGNPDRLARGPVRVRPDDRWHRDLPGRAAATATALALPLLHRYGYPLRTPGAADRAPTVSSAS